METQNIIENIENVVIVEKKKRGRPLKGMEKPKVENPGPKKLGRPLTAWRHKEDGSYNSSSIDPAYAMKYWRTHYQKPYLWHLWSNFKLLWSYTETRNIFTLSASKTQKRRIF